MTVLPGDYFELFDLPQTLIIDEADLQRKFYELSRRHHPDRFAGRSAEEQQQALDMTALLNDAYRTLRDPLKRAEYVLGKEGFDIGEQRSKDVPPELLEEVFELNMMLEASPDRAELEAARSRFASMQKDVDDRLEEEFKNYSRRGDRSVLASIRGLLNRRRYIQNLLRDVEKALA